MAYKYKNFIAGRCGPENSNPMIELDNLDDTINEWLAKNQIGEIIQMAQSAYVLNTDPGIWHHEVLISIIYRE